METFRATPVRLGFMRQSSLLFTLMGLKPLRTSGLPFYPEVLKYRSLLLRLSPTNSLRVDYEVTATGGDDPELYIVADTVDHGKDLYKWQFRLELGKAGLGEGSTILAGLNA